MTGPGPHLTHDIQYAPEFRLEPDGGFRMRDGQMGPWQGWRVTYRPHGVRRWSTFLLEDEDVSLEAVDAAIQEHIKGRA